MKLKSAPILSAFLFLFLSCSKESLPPETIIEPEEAKEVAPTITANDLNFSVGYTDVFDNIIYLLIF